MEVQSFVGGSGHENIILLKQKPNYDPAFLKWAFVRDPYDRLASAYFWNLKSHSKDPGVKKIKEHCKNFPEFVDKIEMFLPEDPLKNDVHDVGHIMPMYYFIGEEMDFIGRFENLKEDWNRLCIKIEKVSGKHIRNKNLSHKNNGKHKQEGTYNYLYTNQMKRKIKKVYEKDFKTYGYE